MRLIRYQKPNFPPDVEADLRQLDAESVRDLLRVSTDGWSGTGGQTMIRLPHSQASRDSLLAWIQWQNAIRVGRENWRFWSTLVIAAIAAVAAVVAALESWLSLKS